MECKLKDIMRRLNKTTKELSRETGISENTIKKYRNNEIKIIDLKTLNKLCNNLHCDTNELFK